MFFTVTLRNGSRHPIGKSSKGSSIWRSWIRLRRRPLLRTRLKHTNSVNLLIFNANDDTGQWAQAMEIVGSNVIVEQRTYVTWSCHSQSVRIYALDQSLEGSGLSMWLKKLNTKSGTTEVSAAYSFNLETLDEGLIYSPVLTFSANPENITLSEGNSNFDVFACAENTLSSHGVKWDGKKVWMHLRPAFKSICLEGWYELCYQCQAFKVVDHRLGPAKPVLAHYVKKCGLRDHKTIGSLQRVPVW